MKSALFVDFDNVYSGLRRLDQETADLFARNPTIWMNWLIKSLEMPEPSTPGAKRRAAPPGCARSSPPSTRRESRRAWRGRRPIGALGLKNLDVSLEDRLVMLERPRCSWPISAIQGVSSRSPKEDR